MARKAFDVISTPGEAQLTLTLRGEFDIATRPIFLRALSAAVAGTSEVLVIDLSELTFIDAFGLEALVLARDSMRVRSRQVIIENPTPWLAKVIAVSGLGDLLQAPEQRSSAPTDRRRLNNDGSNTERAAPTEYQHPRAKETSGEVPTI